MGGYLAEWLADAVRLLRHARQSFEMARCLGRSKLDRPLIPLTGLAHVRADAQNPRLGQNGPIKSQAKLKRSLRITGNGRTFEQKSGRLNVTMLQQIPPELDQAGDLFEIQWRQP